MDGNNNQLANLIELAERALESKNWAGVQKYYGQIVLYDPTDWEAYFYSVYAEQMLCDEYQVENAARNIKNLVSPTLNLIDKYIEDGEYKQICFEQVHLECMSAACEFNTKAYNLFEYNVRSAARNAAIPTHDRQIAAIVDMLRYSADIFAQRGLNNSANELRKFANDSSFKTSKQSGGCYVATAVYGSYDCPEVWTLRRYRDYDLAKTFWGSLFIKVYYSLSPTFVKLFGNKKWFKMVFKGRLDRFVIKLRNKGYLSTPYEDQDWC